MRIAAAVSLVLALVLADAAHAAPRPKLKSFSDCTDLVNYARKGALRTYTPPREVVRPVTAPPPVPRAPAPEPQRTAGGNEDSASSAPTADMPSPAATPVPASGEGVSGGGTVPDFSGTNVQEADVDEPDIVKTDGTRIFAVVGGQLRVVDVASGTVTGTLKLEGNRHQLMLRGNRVLVIAGRGAVYEPMFDRPIAPLSEYGGSSTTIVTEIDVSGAPKVMRTMEVEGSFVDARQNGATARLVIDAATSPIDVGQGETVEDAVEDTSAREFLGRTVLKSKLSGKTFRRNLAPCSSVTHPRQFSGLGVIAILTVDLDRGMYSLDRDGVMAGAQVVYGSAGNLYVASRRYMRALDQGADVPEGVHTEIHRFDVTNPERTVYRASGTVPGFILNNYALSEHEGKLRVATTEEPTWVADGPSQASRSTVTVLDQQANRLVRIGSVTGLGEGERIYAVRFMGTRGYVVTFREIDPLYTLDLTDPTAPKVVGELKIPGYSAYLHPVGENRLLGIGREGAAVQASLFDVSNPASPQRLSQLDFGSGATAVEFDPHAFLYWAPANLAVMPLRTSGLNDAEFLGAAGIRISPTALTDAGRIVHGEPGQQALIERSFVIGDRLYTLSATGLLASRLDDLGAARFTAFGD